MHIQGFMLWKKRLQGEDSVLRTVLSRLGVGGSLGVGVGVCEYVFRCTYELYLIYCISSSESSTWTWGNVCEKGGGIYKTDFFTLQVRWCMDL